MGSHEVDLAVATSAPEIDVSVGGRAREALRTDVAAVDANPAFDLTEVACCPRSEPAVYVVQLYIEPLFIVADGHDRSDARRV